jgi:NADH-quinone oxidoreductase subunit A
LPENVISAGAAHGLVITGLIDILVFFGVLLVGFAYVWKRGDLDWVRAMTDTSKHRSVSRAAPTAAATSDRKLEPVA